MSDACTYVIFGATGNLSRIKLMPALYHLEAPVRRITMYDLPFPLFGRENMYMPSPEKVVRAIHETLND